MDKRFHTFPELGPWLGPCCLTAHQDLRDPLLMC